MASGQGGGPGNAGGPGGPGGPGGQGQSPAAAMQAAIAAAGPPYPPQTQSLGTPPTPNPDVPVSAVFLALFLFAGVAHLALFVRNKKNQFFFPLSMPMFIFCLIRVISTSLRMAWSYDQRNVNLAIAAQIFVAAGTVILYIINLFFTQRLMRARHPHIGWHRPFKVLIPGVTVGLTVICLIMVITVVVQQFFTLNPNTHRIDRDVQWAVLSYFTLVAFLPIPIVAIMLAIPRRTYIDRFGSGRFRTKVGILILSSSLLTLGAGFRCGTSFLPATPTMAPTPWYFSKACFYCFDFLVEIIVVIVYALVRVDRRFYVPPGAHGEGEYSAETMQEAPKEGEVDIFTLNPDGRTLSLADGRTFSLGDKRTFSMADRSSMSQSYLPDPVYRHRAPSASVDSVTSSQYMAMNRKSGRYELRDMPSSSLAGAQELPPSNEIHELDPEPHAGPRRSDSSQADQHPRTSQIMH